MLRRTDYSFDSAVVRYLRDDETGAVSLLLLPTEHSADAYDSHRTMLNVPELVRIGMDCPAWHIGSLVHLSVSGDAQGNGAGNTMKYGASTTSLQFTSQTRCGNTIETLLTSACGYQVIHKLTWLGQYFSVEITFQNLCSTDILLDFITSFSLDNLSPYLTADARNLLLHRFRGGWSMEGLHVVDSIEDLNLACPWTYSFPESERFGAIGSHPCKRYFPTCVVEDPDAGVFWGAALAVPGSWQMELSRDSDCYSLSGGLGDRETASWSHIVPAGASFTPPIAYLSVGTSLDDACCRLTSAHLSAPDDIPSSENDLPVVFNEWCTTWGNPSHDRMLTLADSLAGSPVKYLVIDAGWTDVIPFSFGQGGNGDWNYAKDRFPDGLLATSRALKEKGFITGIWFEFEVTTQGARVYEHDWDNLHLKRDGQVIVTGDQRSFWDFRNSAVISYLKRKVIDFLRSNEIGYLKVDYNGSIGVGCDGSGNIGDGLQEHLNAVLAFFDLIHQELPQLVIESCASGGHRLTIPFTQRASMVSFSDAHEGPEIPIIAARLHRLVPLCKLQIWAVLHPSLTKDALSYRLASGFLGRMCLSGEVDLLSKDQQQWVRQALALYGNAADIIRAGTTTIYGSGCRNLRHLTGWQCAFRLNAAGTQALAVVHTFGMDDSSPICVPIPDGIWETTSVFSNTLQFTLQDHCMTVSNIVSNCGAVVLLHKIEEDSDHARNIF